jgi:hypothetical protein
MKRTVLVGLKLWLVCFCISGQAQQKETSFRVLAFYTARHDPAHISFVEEANRWFAVQSQKHGFFYTTTQDWNKLSPDTLAAYQVVVFLDTRPDSLAQRRAFEQYIRNGGSWIGFHFSAFALTPSQYPQNWAWYHEQFLGCGEYQSNTWRPTAARLRVEKQRHPVTRGLPALVSASPNEWYRWKNDLRKNRNIEVLLSIDSSSFPLGTGPKPSEIWHGGDYPVVWTNKSYRMIYFNMGHNDMDYEGGTNLPLSHTFDNPVQDQLVLNALLWLGKRKCQSQEHTK